MLKKFFIVLFILGCTGCYRISYKVTLDQGKTFRNTYWNHFFIYGFVPVKERYNFDELCANGTLSKLDSKMVGANLLTSIFSFGLTGATTLSAQCIAKATPAKEPSKGK